MTTEELARLALATLDKQAECRDHPKHSLQMERADYERKLRQACNDVIRPPSPGLFDQPKPDQP